MFPTYKLLFPLTLAFATYASSAADTCTPVRPNGLSEGAVNRIVLQKVADALDLPTERVDPGKTIRQLAPSDSALMKYALIVVGIGDALVFDSAAAFYEANKVSGKAHPVEGITVATMQALAHKAYFAGSDAPPPEAPPGATFKTRRFSVSVPSQPSRWSLIVCNADQFVFRSRDPSNKDVYTAATRDISLEPFTTAEAFLAQVKAAAASLAPAGHTLNSAEVGLAERPGPPCAFLSANAILAAPQQDNQDGVRTQLYAQFCYDSKYPHLGYAAFFSHSGQASASIAHEFAMSFINSVRAAR